MNWHRQVPALLSAEPYCWPQLALARAWRGWAHDSGYDCDDDLRLWLRLRLRHGLRLCTLRYVTRTTTKRTTPIG